MPKLKMRKRFPSDSILDQTVCDSAIESKKNKERSPANVGTAATVGDLPRLVEATNPSTPEGGSSDAGTTYSGKHKAQVKHKRDPFASRVNPVR